MEKAQRMSQIYGYLVRSSQIARAGVRAGWNIIFTCLPFWMGSIFLLHSPYTVDPPARGDHFIYQEGRGESPAVHGPSDGQPAATGRIYPGARNILHEAIAD